MEAEVQSSGKRAELQEETLNEWFEWGRPSSKNTWPWLETVNTPSPYRTTFTMKE